MHSANKNIPEMTEKELAGELKKSLLVLSTSSPDKRIIYRALFSSHALDKDNYGGVDIFFTHSGALGIPPRKTPEKTNDYIGNLREKAYQLMDTLQEQQVDKNIRAKLINGGKNEFNPAHVNITGMVEDSGWELIFKDEALKKKFVNTIIRDLKPKLRDHDQWLLRKLDETGFPGPNLKPIQEHLEGGFNELMEMIYKTANELKIKDLQFSSTTNVAFVSPRLGKISIKTFQSTGRLLTENEYDKRLLQTKDGDDINSNFVHVPDSQSGGGQKTINDLLKEGLHTQPSYLLPADYTRRDMTEYLQNLVGKRKSSREERKREVNIAFLSPSSDKPGNISLSLPHDYKRVSIPTEIQLLDYPHLKLFGDADVLVLVPEHQPKEDNHLRSDPNFGLVMSAVVSAETDPESMGVPVVLYNRRGQFNNTLKLVTDAFAQGRLMGNSPFYVANNEKELLAILREVKDFKQRAPVIRTAPADRKNPVKSPRIETVPNDGVFTVFVGGGHANNAKRDLNDAADFGYHCAEHNWRIVTGAGSVEGSMGAVHTGFVQYHLDKLRGKSLSKADKEVLNGFIMDANTGRYDAERLILDRPDFVDKLADEGYIPRKMFYGYSMKPLLEMESPSGKPPPGITYLDAGNRVRRLKGLLAPGTKIFLSGGFGTDEEFEATVKQHIDARKRKQQGVANDDSFSDGTPDNDGTMIVYNRNGRLDRLLRNYGLLGNDPITIRKRKEYNIDIVDSLEQLKEKADTRGGTWLERVWGPPDESRRQRPQR